MNHICFGINDTIILFLSFIRSNTQIIMEITKEEVCVKEETKFDCMPMIEEAIANSDKMLDKPFYHAIITAQNGF